MTQKHLSPWLFVISLSLRMTLSLFERENSIRFQFEDIGVEREMIAEQNHASLDENLV